MAETNPIIQLVPEDDFEDQFEDDDYAPLLNCSHVNAVCTKIRKLQYWYGRVPTPKYIFTFIVDQPQEYQGIELEMHVNLKWKTKKPPKGSKLAKLKNNFCPDGRWSKKHFLGKMFVCRLKKTKGDAPYTDVDTLEKRLTG